MDRLLGLPTGLLAAAAAMALVAVLAGLALLAWRRPLLARIGLRAVPRRPLRTALIVLGLTSSTAVITTAIGTGETMAGAIRSAIAGGIGPVDAIVIAGSPGRTGATPGLRDARAVLAGGDLAAGQYFNESLYQQLAATFATDPAVAAFEPALQSQATAVSPLTGRARTGVNVLGLPPGAEGALLTTFATTGGESISLAGLEPSEVLVNAEAARLLALAPYDSLILQLPEEKQIAWRVRALVRDGGLAGAQAAVIVPLDQLQGALERPAHLNQILIAFEGTEQRRSLSETVTAALRDPRSLLEDRSATARSRDITGRLRLALADREVMQRAARALATDSGQSQLRALERRVRPEARPAIARLREVSRTGEATPELAYYLADPLLTGQYRWVLNAVAGEPGQRGRDLTDRLAPATVLEVKERAISAANEYGSAVTTIFLVLGLFSIAASLLLVFLIFVMLASERRTEMGMMRALGVQRGHLVTAFAIEGLVYDLLASLIGLGFGVGVGAVVLRLMQDVTGRFDFIVRGRISAGGLVLSFALGALVTFATVLLASWRVSRVNIVAAIHGAPDLRGRRRRRSGLAGQARGAAAMVLRGLLLWGPLPAVTGLALVALAERRGALLAAGGALLVLATAMAARALLVALGARRALVDRLIATVAGPVILLFFALSPDPPPTLRTDAAIRAATAGFVLAGVAMALALVWVAAQNLDLLLAPVRLLAKPFGSLAPATKMAVAYPLTHPFRTALTAAMFALVFLTMVAATTLLRSTEAAYVKRDGGAGFDIRALFTAPPADLPAALDGSTAVRRDDFTVIGSQAMAPVEALWPGENPAVWRPVEVRVANAELLAGSSGQLMARAAGLRSDQAVWQTLLERPGTALVSRHELSTLPAVQAAIDARVGGIASFAPATVWLRDPRGGAPHKLMIVGVTGEGQILPSGLLTSRDSMTGSLAADQPPAEFFLRTREDVSFRSAATGIQLTFPDSGVRTRVLGDEARTGQAIRELLDTLIRGFLGMGLFSGIAALGVIGMRSVAERRQQIGMLRAIGFTRRAVRTTFLIEGSVVAMLGITAGAIVGLVLAKNVVAFLARDFPHLELLVPWGQVLALAGAAYAAALASALLVAWQSGRIPPADALRYE